MPMKIFFVVMALLLSLTLPWNTGVQCLDEPLPIDQDDGDLCVVFFLEEDEGSAALAIPIVDHAELSVCNCGKAMLQSDAIAFTGEAVAGPGIHGTEDARSTAPLNVHNGEAVHGPGVNPRPA